MDTVPVGLLKPADSPRLHGEDPDHIRLLAESDATLPPLLVHRGSMRVVDGMHRLRVAQLRGDTEVRVQYFDGTEFEAFIRAVQLNVTHGLPLTLADREAAAARIIESSDSWSDRAIARMTGLSAPTVGRIRAHHLPDHPIDTQARIGLDGRVRPLNSVAGRRRASELIDTEPTLSLREIAKRAGISVGTARDVRKRLGRGEDPIPARFLPGPATAPAVATGPHGHPPAAAAPPSPSSMAGTYTSNLNSLKNDPSLCLTSTGRFLLRWLSLHAISREKRAGLIKSLPAHSKSRIAGMAKYCSRWWAEFADDLEEQQQEYQDIPKTGYRLTR
ncbi:ParB/RepB/Spo0J family partition protein [Kitasatospora sp. NBC_01266]|uniref:ParB/RepB/Spo0J family partition protein n=1 Tax=Kitasatospora sp. NBC_01266 TaxID=2903572 RepID=UPI002E35A659|nr:streptomycin biosynthesis regulator [Kitasatospora sp. NBC_01266]